MTDKLDPKMRPVNGNAARVIFGEAVHYKPEKELTQAYVEMPELEDDEKRLEAIIRNKGGRKAIIEVFTKKFGRLKVIGISKDGCTNLATRKSKGVRLVCRCDCGHYVVIRRRPLVQGLKDRCGWCDQTEWLRNGAPERSKRRP